MSKKSTIISSDNNEKFLLLELLRFISAFSVFIWHYQNFSFGYDSYNIEEKPFYWLLKPFYNYGYIGVEIFWCISGFIFFIRYRDKVDKNIIDYKKFFILRFSRIYPLHFLTLILVAILQLLYFARNDLFFVYHNNNITSFIYNLFLINDWTDKGNFSYNGPIWSVSVEVFIYIFFFINRSFKTIIFIFILCIFAKDIGIKNSFINCFVYFHIGYFCAIFFNYLKDKKNYIKVIYFWILLSFILTYINIFFYIIFLLSIIFLTLILLSEKISINDDLKKIISTSGNISYSIYLIQFPIQLFIANYFTYTDQKIPYSQTDFFICYFLVTIFSSYLIYNFFEYSAKEYIRKKFIPTQ